MTKRQDSDHSQDILTGDHLPNSWVSAKLGDVFEFEYGKALKKSNRVETGKFPVFGSNGIVGYHDEYLVDAPALIIGRKGSVGEVCTSKQNFWAIDTTYYVKISDEINFDFAYYMFKYLNLAKLEKSTAIPGLNRNDAYQLEINLPPRKEQERIVAKIEELFSELDKGVEYLETAREQLKVYRQSLLKNAFEGKLTEEWRKNHAEQLETGDQLLKRIKQERDDIYQEQINHWEKAVKTWEENEKEGKKPKKPKIALQISSLIEKELSELPVLPKTWCWVKLSAIAEKIQIGPFGSLLHRSDYVENGIPLVNPVHINDQKIEPDSKSRITQEKWNELSNYVMHSGDIVMGRRGEMGRCAVITQNEDGFLCGSGSLFIRLLPRLNPYYYCQYLSSQRMKNYLAAQSIGSTMQNLNQGILNNLPVPFCSFSEQQKIIEELYIKIMLQNNMEAEINENLRKANVIRQGILEQAFSGQLVPQNPEDESAAILLERIKEYRKLQEENKPPKSKIKRKYAMKKKLSIVETLKKLNGQAAAQDVWQQSRHQEDIENFYAELKRDITNGTIEELKDLRENDKSYLKLTNEN